MTEDIMLIVLLIIQIAVAAVYLIVFPIIVKREHNLVETNRTLSAEIATLRLDMRNMKLELNNLIIDLDKELSPSRRQAAIEDLCKTCICRIRFDLDRKNESS